MADETMTANNDSTNEQQDNLVRCPCCGKMTLQRPIKPGDDLLDHWLACTATGVPFSHTYSLYGGKVLITAYSPDTETEIRLANAASTIDRAIGDGGYTEITETGLRTLVNAVRLYSTVREIVFTGDQRKRFDTGAAAGLALDELDAALAQMRGGEGPDAWGQHLTKAHAVLDNKANVSSLPSNILIAVGRTHSQLSDIMMSAGFDEDFWHGIELA